MTVEEVLLRIRQNLPFIRGITCSGGECTLYAGFMAELFAKTKAMGLTNLIDSNGILDFSKATSASPEKTMTWCCKTPPTWLSGACCRRFAP